MGELLASVAEVSVAIAGFAGLFVAFSGRARTLTSIERYAMLFLLFASLGATLLAMLPPVLMGFTTGKTFEPWFCTFSCAMLVALGTWSTRTRLRKTTSRRRYPWLRRTLMPLLWVIAVMQMLPFIGAMDARAVYAVALWWLVAAAAVQFVMQIAAATR